MLIIKIQNLWIGEHIEMELCIRSGKIKIIVANNGFGIIKKCLYLQNKIKL